MTNNEILLLEIFTVQVIAGVLGTASIGAADWSYHDGHIRQGVYSVWVSSSITVIWLPVLAWTFKVFLGFGMLTQVFFSVIGGSIFFWVYHNLRKLPSVQELGNALPHPRSSNRQISPPSKLSS